jgi:hypothetical protein
VSQLYESEDRRRCAGYAADDDGVPNPFTHDCLPLSDCLTKENYSRAALACGDSCTQPYQDRSNFGLMPQRKPHPSARAGSVAEPYRPKCSQIMPAAASTTRQIAASPI